MIELRAFARDLGERLPRIAELYLCGSRVTGSAREDSDIDLIAVVTGRCRPGWRAPRRAPAGGFPSVLDGVPLHWCLTRAGDFDQQEIEAGGALLLWRRDTFGQGVG